MEQGCAPRLWLRTKHKSFLCMQHFFKHHPGLGFLPEDVRTREQPCIKFMTGTAISPSLRMCRPMPFMARDVGVLILGSYKNVTSLGQRDFIGLSKVKDLEVQK